MAHFPQQGHNSQPSPNRTINWGQNHQMPETGEYLIQTTTPFYSLFQLQSYKEVLLFFSRYCKVQDLCLALLSIVSLFLHAI